MTRSLAVAQVVAQAVAQVQKADSRELTAVQIKKILEKKENGVYTVGCRYYMIYDGEITFFNGDKLIKVKAQKLTPLFFRRIKMCKNSDALIELMDRLEYFSNSWGEDYGHLVSAKKKIDNYVEIMSVDVDSMRVNVFDDRMVSNRESGQREYDTESYDTVEVDFCDVDDYQHCSELPAWTDSEPDTDSDEDSSEDSSEDEE